MKNKGRHHIVLHRVLWLIDIFRISNVLLKLNLILYSDSQSNEKPTYFRSDGVICIFN